MYMGVDRPGRGDQALARDDRRSAADDDVDAFERVRVAGSSDAGDSSVADSDRRLANALDGVDHQDVADDQVAGLPGGRGQDVQSVARGLAEADDELLARLAGVGLDLDDEAGVSQSHPVALPGPVRGDVVA